MRPWPVHCRRETFPENLGPAHTAPFWRSSGPSASCQLLCSQKAVTPPQIVWLLKLCSQPATQMSYDLLTGQAMSFWTRVTNCAHFPGFSSNTESSKSQANRSIAHSNLNLPWWVHDRNNMRRTVYSLFTSLKPTEHFSLFSLFINYWDSREICGLYSNSLCGIIFTEISFVPDTLGP